MHSECVLSSLNLLPPCYTNYILPCMESSLTKVIIDNPDRKYKVSNFLTSQQIKAMEKILTSVVQDKLRDLKYHFGLVLHFEPESPEIICVPVQGKYSFIVETKHDFSGLRVGELPAADYEHCYDSYEKAVEAQQRVLDRHLNMEDKTLHHNVRYLVKSSMTELDNIDWRSAAYTMLGHQSTCYDCHGSGKIRYRLTLPGSNVTCSNCEGHGEFQCSVCYGHGWYKSAFTPARTCEYCRGHGYHECETCCGSGSVKSKPFYFDELYKCEMCDGHGFVHSTHSVSTDIRTERQLHIAHDDLKTERLCWFNAAYKTNTPNEIFSTSKKVIWNPELTKKSLDERTGRVLEVNKYGCICFGELTFQVGKDSYCKGFVVFDISSKGYLRSVNILEPRSKVLDIELRRQLGELTNLLQSNSGKDEIKSYIKRSQALNTLHRNLHKAGNLKLKYLITCKDTYNHAVKVLVDANRYLSDKTEVV